MKEGKLLIVVIATMLLLCGLGLMVSGPVSETHAGGFTVIPSTSPPTITPPTPIPTSSPMPTSSPPVAVGYVREISPVVPCGEVELEYELERLDESQEQLWSELVDLGAYVDQYVAVWGDFCCWIGPPSCCYIRVERVEPRTPPATPTPTSTSTPTPSPTPTPWCPFLVIVKEEEVGPLRRWQRLLPQSRKGKRAMRLYHVHRGEVVRILLENPSLAQEVKALLVKLLPEIKNGEFLFTEELIARLEDLADKFAKRGSKKLQADIEEGKKILEGLEGQTLKEIFAPRPNIYLPPAVK